MEFTPPTDVMTAPLDAYERATFVESVVPALASCGVAAVEMWSFLLNTALDSELPPSVIASGRDLSLDWRPDITTDSDARKYDAKSAFTTAIIITCDLLLQAEPRQTTAVVAALSRHSRSIFRRLALYVLELHPDVDLVRAYLTDRANFDDPTTRRDYRMLARTRAQFLEDADIARILEWIGEGDHDRFARTYGAAMGHPPSEEDLSKHQAIWRRDWLRAFRPKLSGQLVAELDELEVRFPAPAEDRSAVRVTTWTGSTGPLSSEELGQLGAADLIDFAKSWKPSADPFGPSVDGLLNQITQAAASAPSGFLSLTSAQLEGAGPTIVDAIARGVQRALEAGLRPPWADLISFSKWAVGQKEIPSRDGDSFDYLPDWTDIHLTVARVLSICLKEKSDSIPIEEATRIWQIILRLAGSQHPTPEFESQFGPPNMSPMTLSLNTVRAQALHLAIEYASWQRRLKGEVWSGLPSEVRELLEKHLDPAIDPSIAVRSVYGMRLTTLSYLDLQWVADHVVTIFGHDADDKLGQVAWGDYLFNQVYTQIFDLLEPRYWMAIEERKPPAVAGHDEPPEFRLAAHLAALYTWGRLDLDGSSSLVRRFFELSSPSAKHRFLETIGQILEGNPRVPSEVADRVTHLWEWRWDSLADDQPADRCEELAAFGLWFGISDLNAAWSLFQLERVMTSCDVIDNEYRVLQRVADMSDAFPRQALTIVGLLSERSARTFYGWEDAAKQILRRASIQSDVEVQTKAFETINRLVARGFATFRDLI